MEHSGSIKPDTNEGGIVATQREVPNESKRQMFTQQSKYKAARRVKEESMRVNAEFDAVEDAPDE
jgi:hypothetical protein